MFVFRYQQKKNAFTLLETIFAVAIILIAVIAIFGLVNLGISSIGASKSKLIAVELAQEGVEVARWWRDAGGSVSGVTWTPTDWDNWFSDVDGLKGYFRILINPANPSNSPIIDKCLSGNPSGCANWSQNTYNPPINSPADLYSWFQLWLDPATGLYNHSSVGISTNFYRLVHLSNPQSSGDGQNNKRVITSEVFWVERGNLRSVRLVDHLYNWWNP